MNENVPDRRSGEAFDRERSVALSSLLQKQFGVVNFACLVSSPPAVRLYFALDQSL